MALGTAVLGAATAGIGILVGGVIFNVSGSSLSNKADEAWSQMKKAEESINKICKYFNQLNELSNSYRNSILLVQDKYKNTFDILYQKVKGKDKVDWHDFTNEEKLATENSVLLVGLLYKMCQVNLVNQPDKDDDIPTVNKEEVDINIDNANKILEQVV